MHRIDVQGAGLTLGNNPTAPQGRDLRHFTISDNLTWQKGSHRMRFGGEWEYEYGPGFWAQFEPAALELYSPSTVRAYNATLPPGLQISLPSSYNTIAAVLQLPMSSFITGAADPAQPPFFHRDQANPTPRSLFFAQESGPTPPRLTFI